MPSDSGENTRRPRGDGNSNNFIRPRGSVGVTRSSRRRAIRFYFQPPRRLRARNAAPIVSSAKFAPSRAPWMIDCKSTCHAASSGCQGRDNDTANRPQSFLWKERAATFLALPRPFLGRRALRRSEPFFSRAFVSASTRRRDITLAATACQPGRCYFISTRLRAPNGRRPRHNETRAPLITPDIRNIRNLFHAPGLPARTFIPSRAAVARDSCG